MKNTAMLMVVLASTVACGGGAGGGGGGGGPGPDVVAFIADARTSNVPELLVADAGGSNVRVVSGPFLANAAVHAFAWDPSRTRIAFVADRDTDEHFELYVTDVATGTVTKLSTHLAGDVQDDVAWSADGLYVGYRVDSAFATRFEMWCVPAAGGAPVMVCPAVVANGDVLSFRWSPVGHRLAYHGDATTDTLYQVRLVDPDGSNWILADIPQGSITSADYEDDYAWRPDGARIGYRFDPAGTGDKRLFSCLADGTGLVTHSTPIGAGRTVDSFAWSPDSLKVAYVSDQDTAGAFETFVGPASGGVVTKVGTAAVTAVCSDLAWSPDSSRLAWRVVKSLVGAVDLATNVAAGGFEAILRSSAIGHSVAEFAWAPDGAHIAYTADVDTPDVFELYTVSPTTTLTLKRSMELEPAGRVYAFAWAPDSSALLFTADDLVDDVRDLYRTGATGGSIAKLSSEVSVNDDVAQFAWSTDGAHVLFAGALDPFAPRALAITNAAGGGLVELTAGFPNLTLLEEFAPR